MEFQFLAADASISALSCQSRSSPTHLCLQSGPSRYLYPGNSSLSLTSSPSSLTLHLDYSGYGGHEARLFCVSKATRVQFEGQESCALFLECKETSIFKQGQWFQGASHHHSNREMHHRSPESMEAYGCTESMSLSGCVRSRKTSISHTTKESRVCLGFGLHPHECAYARGLCGSDNRKRTISGGYEDKYQLSRSWKWSCLPQGHSFFVLRNLLQRRNSNACQCIFPNFLKKGFFATEKDEKLKQRDRQRALLSLCGQAMVASQIGQSSLLCFLWTIWPSLVDELCGGGKGGGSKNNTLNGQAREPDNAYFFQSPLWKALFLGFVCGSVIVLAINSSVSAGALLDACLWLCLLYSLLCLAAFVTRILCLTVMFISGGGITTLPNSCIQTLQKWIRTSFCQVFFAGLGTLFDGMYWLNRSPKPRSPTARLLMSSLWSR